MVAVLPKRGHRGRSGGGKLSYDGSNRSRHFDEYLGTAVPKADGHYSKAPNKYKRCPIEGVGLAGRHSCTITDANRHDDEASRQLLILQAIALTNA